MKHIASAWLAIALGFLTAAAQAADPPTPQTSPVDIERAIVRGTLYPAEGELRTVSRLHLRLSSPRPRQAEFILNPSRRVARITGPGGEDLSYEVSTRRWYVYGVVYSRVTVSVPEARAAHDTLDLTFFIEGGVGDKGAYKLGDFLDRDGIAALGSVLMPELDIYGGPLTDDFLWLELELNAPVNWVLGSAGTPLITEVPAGTAPTTHTALSGREVDGFLGPGPAGAVRQHYWNRIGVNAGLYYLNGGGDWTVQRRETSAGTIGLYASRQDSAGAAAMLEAAEKMIPAMQNDYGPFPFKDLSLVISRPGHFGGGPALDSWSMATFPVSYLAWDRGSQRVFAHELIHQYWNQSLRVPFRQALALCEPFASCLDNELWAKVFAESLAFDANLGSRVGDATTYWLAAQVYREQPLVDLRLETDPFATPGLYCKGSLGVAMLADLLGPDGFRQFHHGLFSRGDGSPYNLDTLRAGLSRQSHYDCASLVHDIFEDVVHYDYSIDRVDLKAVPPDSCSAAVSITRRAAGAFPMLLKVSFADTSAVTSRIEPGPASQTITVHGPVPFRKAELDPEVRTLDHNRFDNVYPRRQRLTFAWGRRRVDRLPYPVTDWGGFGYASRRIYLSPVIDYTDFDGYRTGIGLETRMAYRDKKYAWVTWSEESNKVRAGAGWFLGSNVKRTKVMLSYDDDGLVRDAALTAYGLSWKDRIMFSPGIGYEERPSAVATEAEGLRYAQSAPSLRLGVIFPYADYLTGFMLGSRTGCYLLTLGGRRAVPIWGGKLDLLQVEGDSRIVLGALVARLRWGVSDDVDSEGEGFALGGRWGYADDRVRMVRGYDLSFSDRFVLLNAECRVLPIPGGAFVLFSDLAQSRAVGSKHSSFLLGYGIGVRYWLPWTDWLESVPVRIDFAAPRDGLDKGRICVGVWSAL